MKRGGWFKWTYNANRKLGFCRRYPATAELLEALCHQGWDNYSVGAVDHVEGALWCATSHMSLRGDQPLAAARPYSLGTFRSRQAAQQALREHVYAFETEYMLNREANT